EEGDTSRTEVEEAAGDGEVEGEVEAEGETEVEESSEAAAARERDRQMRAQASIKEREKEVQRALATSLRDRDKEREYHKRDEAVQHFNALLADLVRNPDLTWREAKKQLKKDHRYKLAELLSKEDKPILRRTILHSYIPRVKR
ncbi:Transcription elongation regulator 1, partial [Papilio xuthus]